MIGKIGEIVQLATSNWRPGELVDLWPLVQEVTQKVAVGVLFGAKESFDVAEALVVADLIHNHIRMASSPGVRGCPINLYGLPYWRMLRHAEYVEAALTSWAKKRRGQTRSNDLLLLAVNSLDENGNQLDDVLIAGQVLTLLGASYETCQTALTWMLFLLAQHPVHAAR